jgi:hypothetical protein
MKVEVIKTFFDKYTYERYDVGTLLDFDKERAEIAEKRGHVKILPVKKATKKKTETKAEEEEK